MTVLVDTHVLISAVATRGLCADVMREILAVHELVISEQILAEVRTVMQGKLGAGEDLTSEFIRFLEENGTLAQPAYLPEAKTLDRPDRLILGAAIAARVGLMITGDREMLALGRVEEVTIVSPRQFWEKFGPTRKIDPANSEKLQ